jgi:hypothetical protein
METKSLLDEADVRSMVRLLGETCTLKGTINQKKHFLMEGLCRLIDPGLGLGSCGRNGPGQASGLRRLHPWRIF